MQDLGLDRTDRRILRLLQSRPDITAAIVGEEIGASQATCWRRMQKMREDGLIPPQKVTLDRRRLGLNTMVFAQVKLTSSGRTNVDKFAAAIRDLEEVMECYVILGSSDFLLKVVTPDNEAYERFFFEKLSRIEGVLEINSTIAMTEIKRTSELPI